MQPNAQVSDELNGLPYVSRSGLQQQAAVQVVSVKTNHAYKRVHHVKRQRVKRG